MEDKDNRILFTVSYSYVTATSPGMAIKNVASTTVSNLTGTSGTLALAGQNLSSDRPTSKVLPS